MTTEEIGRIVKERRDELNKTTYATAKSASLRGGQVTQVERASKNYTIRCLISLCDALNLEVIIAKKDAQ